MKFIAIVFLAPLALAGCQSTLEPLGEGITPALVASAETPTPSVVAANTFRPPAFAPIPTARPDFEGVTPASRALGAVVADANEVDRKLEAQSADAPSKSDAAPVEARKIEPSAEPRVQVAALMSYNAEPPRASLAASAKPANSQGYYAAYPDTIVSCFPQGLRDALNIIAEHYGKEVEVTSGMRDRGRRHSLHRSCLAADIRVPGVGPRELANYAKSVDGVNGVGTYRYNTVTHVDIRQEKMAWRY